MSIYQKVGQVVETQKDRSNCLAVGIVVTEVVEGDVEFRRKIVQQAPATMILPMMPILCTFYLLLPNIELMPSTKRFTLLIALQLHPLVLPIPSTSTACTRV
jgi:hypothetical protein